jgi:CheY-like chemotaxis protein
MNAAKILAVDDEADFEVLLRQRFRYQIRAGEFDFRFAYHGEDALTKLADEPDIELLLLDINMPVMDGLTLLAELRARQSPARAIIVSAYGDMANIRTAMNRGAFDFVTKPVDLNDLEITIKKTLDDIARVREIDRQRAVAERARTNLSRYFSPNLVDMLADRDEPLGPVRRETVAVLFVDIVGFTRKPIDRHRGDLTRHNLAADRRDAPLVSAFLRISRSSLRIPRSPCNIIQPRRCSDSAARELSDRIQLLCCGTLSDCVCRYRFVNSP